MQPDQIHSDADGYYGDNDDASDEELDLSFLDDDKDQPAK